MADAHAQGETVLFGILGLGTGLPASGALDRDHDSVFLMVPCQELLTSGRGHGIARVHQGTPVVINALTIAIGVLAPHQPKDIPESTNVLGQCRAGPELSSALTLASGPRAVVFVYVFVLLAFVYPGHKTHIDLILIAEQGVKAMHGLDVVQNLPHMHIPLTQQLAPHGQPHVLLEILFLCHTVKIR